MKHTKGPLEISSWLSPPLAGIHYRGDLWPIVTHRHATRGGEIVAYARSKDDAELISLAPTAPHDCEDPKCPGRVNKRRLEALADVLNVLHSAKECFTGHNLLSTATEKEKEETISRFLEWWNTKALPVIARAKWFR